MNFWTADFETTVNNSKPQVYSWGLFSMDKLGEIYYDGINIRTFLQKVLSFTEDTVIYFHNGSKFDMHFILPALSSVGLIQKPPSLNQSTIKQIKVSPSKERSFAKRETEDNWLKSGEYSILADGNKKIIELTIGLKSKKQRMGKEVCKTVSFRDSNLLFAGSIKSYGEQLNAFYKTDIWSKDDLSTNYTRTELYNSIEEFNNDGNEREYLKQDCKVLYKYLTMMEEKLPFTKWKLTSASTSYGLWKSEFSDKILPHYESIGIITSFTPKKAGKNSKFKHYKFKNGKFHMSSRKMIDTLLKKILPCDDLNEHNKYGTVISQDMYKWYKGGLTMVNPDFKGVPLNVDNNLSVDVIDINSSYPSVMRSNNSFPMGHFMKGDGGEKYQYKLYKLTALTEMVNENGLPFLGTLTGTALQYLKRNKRGSIFYITSDELERVKKYYKGKWSLEVLYSFLPVPGNFYFGEFIEKANQEKIDAKSSGDIASSNIAKLKSNATYGKFGTNSELESSIWDDENQCWDEKEVVLQKTKFYLPIAIAITSLARMKLVDAVGDNFKYVAYMDTDSLFILSNKRNLFTSIEYDKYELGKWDLEMSKGSGLIRRPKQYIFSYEKDNKTHFKSAFAGINFSRNKTDDGEIKLPSVKEFITGAFVEKQLRPKKLPTGVYLEDHTKEIFPIWDYDKHPDDWFEDEETYLDNVKDQIKKLQTR